MFDGVLIGFAIGAILGLALFLRERRLRSRTTRTTIESLREIHDLAVELRRRQTDVTLPRLREFQPPAGAKIDVYLEAIFAELRLEAKHAEKGRLKRATEKSQREQAARLAGVGHATLENLREFSRPLSAMLRDAAEIRKAALSADLRPSKIVEASDRLESAARAAMNQLQTLQSLGTSRETRARDVDTEAAPKVTSLDELLKGVRSLVGTGTAQAGVKLDIADVGEGAEYEGQPQDFVELMVQWILGERSALASDEGERWIRLELDVSDAKGLHLKLSSSRPAEVSRAGVSVVAMKSLVRELGGVWDRPSVRLVGANAVETLTLPGLSLRSNRQAA